MLIGVAVFAGALLLARGYQSEGNLVSGSSPQTTSAVTTVPPTGLTSTSTTAPTPGTTAVPLKPANTITVKVANASDPSLPLASQGNTKLQGLGYKVSDPVDAPKIAASKVFYIEGYKNEALAVAKVFSIPEGQVEPMPRPAPLNIGNAQILVERGPDQKPN